jgi:hypothetical protein
MIRRALIIYCDDTNPQKPLSGPKKDNINYVDFLTSNLGGHWLDTEIKSLHSPSIDEVKETVSNLSLLADYTFTIYSGHGGHERIQNRQMMELSDGDEPIHTLVNNANRQTLIIDSCRSYYTDEILIDMLKQASILEDSMYRFERSTRNLYSECVMAADEGVTVLFSCSRGQASDDSVEGGLYLSSLLEAAKRWKESNSDQYCLDLLDAQKKASSIIDKETLSIQVPELVPQKRRKYFPFAVKFATL